MRRDSVNSDREPVVPGISGCSLKDELPIIQYPSSRLRLRRTTLNFWIRKCYELNSPTTLTRHSIAIRLILDIIAASVIGIDRDERGRPAGQDFRKLRPRTGAHSGTTFGTWPGCDGCHRLDDDARLSVVCKQMLDMTTMMSNALVIAKRR